MSKLQEQFKAGFTIGEDYETNEILLDTRVQEEHKLQFLMYDANMFPASDISTWSKSARDKVLNFMKLQMKDVNADIFVDDVQIKHYGEVEE